MARSATSIFYSGLGVAFAGLGALIPFSHEQCPILKTGIEFSAKTLFNSSATFVCPTTSSGFSTGSWAMFGVAAVLVVMGGGLTSNHAKTLTELARAARTVGEIGNPSIARDQSGGEE